MTETNFQIPTLLSSKELYEYWLAYQHLRHSNRELFALLSTGIKSLDMALGGDPVTHEPGGVEYGQLMYIGGAQKSGKTTLVKTIAQALARQKIHFVFFSGEMNNYQMGSMVMSDLSGIERTRIRRMGLDVYDFDTLEQQGKQMEDWSGYWNSDLDTIADMYKVVDGVEQKTGEAVRVVLGDYVQLMKDGHYNMNRTAEVEAVSRGLRQMSLTRKLPMAVIFTAQTNRESIRNKIIDANVFSLSSAIEKDMDIGVLVTDKHDEIRPEEVLTGQKLLTIVGAREFSTSEVVVAYNGPLARMGDLVNTSVFNMNVIGR